MSTGHAVDMILRNLTPHEIVLRSRQGDLRIPASPNPARLIESADPVACVSGVDLLSLKYTLPDQLPLPEAGVLLIVPSILREALPGRFDLVSPTRLLRDEDGKVVGAQALAGGPHLFHWLQSSRCQTSEEVETVPVLAASDKVNG